ncbi:MAG: DUF2249 domain-containing protein [Vulcanimicrobiaceae bacterium]
MTDSRVDDGRVATRCLFLDVRPYHEGGQEFLQVNSFDPKPLIRVMDKRGFDAVSREVSPGEWHTLFSPR